MTTKIDWKKVWRSFNSWTDAAQRPCPCKECGHDKSEMPDWEDQKKKIQQLVNKQIEYQKKERIAVTVGHVKNNVIDIKRYRVTP